MKTCNKCESPKSIGEFYKSTNGGTFSECKRCFITSRRGYRAHYAIKNSEKLKEKRKKSYDKEKAKMWQRSWRKRNGLGKQKVRNKVILALEKGILVKTGCQYPNGNCEGRIEGHHWDYSKPLEVVWLCRKHHALAGRVERILQKI